MPATRRTAAGRRCLIAGGARHARRPRDRGRLRLAARSRADRARGGPRMPVSNWLLLWGLIATSILYRAAIGVVDPDAGPRPIRGGQRDHVDDHARRGARAGRLRRAVGDRGAHAPGLVPVLEAARSPHLSPARSGRPAGHASRLQHQQHRRRRPARGGAACSPTSATHRWRSRPTATCSIPSRPTWPPSSTAGRPRSPHSGMACVIETGARHLLDPLVKHEPTLVSADPAARERRIDVHDAGDRDRRRPRGGLRLALERRRPRRGRRRDALGPARGRPRADPRPRGPPRRGHRLRARAGHGRSTRSPARASSATGSAGPPPSASRSTPATSSASASGPRPR